MNISLTFSEYFDIRSSVLDKFGAFNICIKSDLPLFIDPFLLFSSPKKEYIALHEKMVNHLITLKSIALNNPEKDLSVFQFPEVRQNWFGMCKYGNNGKGLGPKFARDLISAFNGFYNNFGEEKNLESSHIEKLTLVGEGIGRDFISDFSTNLALEFLLDYTQAFAIKHLSPHQRKLFTVRCVFDANLEIWLPKTFTLPYFYKTDGDFILLTPIDILTKDDAYICHSDLCSRFTSIAKALDNSALRDGINAYFRSKLPQRPKISDRNYAVTQTLQKFPELIDAYLKERESSKGLASGISLTKVDKLKTELMTTLEEFCKRVASTTNFFNTSPSSYSEALERLKYLKEVIEENDGYRIFYKNGVPIASEDTIQRIFRLTWFASPLDVNSEVNNGRGPADYKISFGKKDSTIVEFKLGKSSSIRANLLHQTQIYKKASKSISDITAILCYSLQEISKVNKILKELKIADADNILIIDASPKKSASKVS